jgi:hypothetical protein
VTLADQAREFFKERPHLRPLHNYIGVRLNEIQNDNPGMTMEDLFKKLREEVDKEFGAVKEIIEEEAKPKAPATGSKPRGPQPGDSAKRNRRKARERGRQLSGIEKEMAEMIKHTEVRR